MNELLEEPGCESYIYTICKKERCCVHPCSIMECPEPICALDFPSMRTFLMYKKMYVLIEQGLNVVQIAEHLGMTVNAVRKCQYRVKLVCR